MSKVDELKELQQNLEIAKADGKITQKGLTTLEAINNGAFNNPVIANVLQGATFAASDEIGAYINSILTPGLSYENALLIEKSGVEQAQKDRPILQYIENAAGAIAPTLMTRGSNLGTVGTGALFGGSYAFGSSEADTDLFSTARLCNN
jgi:hypothetical protein